MGNYYLMGSAGRVHSASVFILGDFLTFFFGPPGMCAHPLMMEMIARAVTASKFYFVDLKFAFQALLWLAVFVSNSRRKQRKRKWKM